jgi:multidrug resistance protein MdtO
MQIALAFLLTVLQGFGPSISLDTAQGRIFGILLGNLVVYLIFTRVWPAPVEGEVRAAFARALAGLARMARLAPASRANAVGGAAAVASLAGRCEEALRLLPFEPGGLRPTPEREAALHGAVDEVEALNRAIWLSRDADLGPTADALDRLAQRFRGPVQGPIQGPTGAPALLPDPAASKEGTRSAGHALITGPFGPPLDRLQGAAG